VRSDTTVSERPAHGTIARSRVCRCTKCCAAREGKKKLKELMEMPEHHWPLRFLENKKFGKLTDFFGQEQVDEWRRRGLSDVEADHVAVFFHTHPMMIWRGWLEAAEDPEFGEDDE